MHSAKINGGIKAFNRSVRRRISILEADDQNCVFLITEITLNCFCHYLLFTIKILNNESHTCNIRLTH